MTDANLNTFFALNTSYTFYIALIILDFVKGALLLLQVCSISR